MLQTPLDSSSSIIM